MFLINSNKKRDLSDKSQNGDDRKKVRDDSGSELISTDDVFEESLQSPECVKILFNCMKNIETQMKELFVMYEESKNSGIKGEKQLESLTQSIDFLSSKFDEIKKDQKEKEEQIEILNNEVNDLRK